MNFYYDPIIGLQWTGGVRDFTPINPYVFDEIGHYPFYWPEPYIQSNAKTTSKKIKFEKY